MKTKIVLFALFGFAFTQAQISLNATGSNGSSAAGSATVSVGQVFYTTSQDSNTSIAAGVQQAFVITILATNESGLNVDLSVYPNPTASVLYLKFADFKMNKSRYELFDGTGRLLLTSNIKENQTSIEMSRYPAGMYILKISDGSSAIKTFKILKK